MLPADVNIVRKA